MATLEELEALRIKPEQQTEPEVAAPTPAKTQAVELTTPGNPIESFKGLISTVRPDLDASRDGFAPLRQNLEFVERFRQDRWEPGTYKGATGHNTRPLSAFEVPQDIVERQLLGEITAEQGTQEWMSRLTEAAKGRTNPVSAFGRGLANVALSTLKAPGYWAKSFHEADVFGDDGVEFDYSWDKPLSSLLFGISEISDKLQRELNEDVDRSKMGWDDKFGESLGSAAGFILGGRFAGAKTPATQSATSATLGAAVGGTTQYEDALAHGASPEDALFALAAGSALGTTEGIPGFYFLKKMNQLGGGKIAEKLNALGMTGEPGLIREAVKGGLTEMLQEGTQTVGENWIARDLVGYDPTRTLGENFWDNVLTAGMTGSTIGGAIQYVRDSQVNDFKQKLEAEFWRKMNSGDAINALATPGNGFGSFTPVENLVAMNKLKDDIDRRIAARADEVYTRLRNEQALREGFDPNDPEMANEFPEPPPTSVPDDFVSDRASQPNELMDLGDAGFRAFGGLELVNTQTEKAILEKGKATPTAKEALLKTPVVALASRYDELVNTIEANMARLTSYINEVKGQLDPASYERESKQLKMLTLRHQQLVGKRNLANHLLGEVKNYTALFSQALNPDMKMIVRDFDLPRKEGERAPKGWFGGSLDVELGDGTRSPVGVLYVDLEELIDSIWIDSRAGKDVSTRTKSAKRALFEIVNHELGHAVMGRAFAETVKKTESNDPEEAREAYKSFLVLVESYRQWIKDMSGANWRTFIETSMPLQRAASALTNLQGGGIDPAKLPISENLPPAWPKRDYYLSFDEFMADMTARLATQGALADPVLTNFFKPILEQYQKIFGMYPEFARNEYGGDLAQFLQARAISYKVAKEIERVKASGSNNLWDGLRGKVAGLNPDNFAGLRHQLDRWNKGLSLGLNLLQLERVFQHVPQFASYRATTEAWSEYQRNFADQATETLENWRSLGKTDAGRLAAIFYYESETGKNLSPAVLARELTGEGLVVYQQVRAQLNRVLDEMQATALRDANRVFSNNSEKLAEASKEISDEFSKLKDSGYFPYVRFGDWTIQARARMDGKYLGKSFKAGELITFQAFESRAERDKKLIELRNELGGGAAVSGGKMRESEFTVQGMPRAILLALRNRLEADGQLSQEVAKSIEQALEAAAPFKNFRNHFKKKQGIHGYSEDAFRTFAHYIRAAAGNISRVRYAGEMRESIDSMQADVRTIQELGGNSTARQEMVHWLRRHFDYIMNPANELAALRGAGFVAYLGFNIKSAFVNSMQMLTTVYPYLAARYGDFSAVSGLAKGGAWLKKWVFNKKDFINAKPGSLEARIADLIGRGNAEGWLDQSLATELAIAASENSLDRSLYLPSAKRWWHNFSRWSALPFHLVEKTNRYVTAIAAYNLNYAETGSHEKAVLAAKLANQQTHFENSRWNRPEFLRGKKSAALLFTNFIQNQLFFITKDPGTVRYFLVMLLLAGVMGLPGAEDLTDVIEASVSKLNKELGMKNPKVQLRVEMRKFLDEMGMNPDLVLHGTSQNSFGLGQIGELLGIPIPRFDLSRSIGMGNLIPGTEIPNMLLSGAKPGDIALEALSQATGAGGNLVEDYYRALFSTNSSDWKRMERLLPLMSLRNMSKAARYYTEGKERAANGVVIADFTPYDTRTGLEIAGQALGFPLTEVQKGWEKEIAIRDATQFYKTWQMSLQRQLNIAYLQEDREAIADVMEQIKRYNSTVPMPEMGIKPKDAKQAVREFLRSQYKAGAGFAADKKFHRLMKMVEEAYPDPIGDTSRTDAAYRP